MAFDGIAVRAITYELAGVLDGGKVEKIYQPGDDEIVMHVHGHAGRVKVYISCNNEHPGMFLTEATYDNPAEPPVFCMLLRKHIQGSRIKSLRQVGCERIIEVYFESKDEMGYIVDKKLVVEIMGRHSNIVLVDVETGLIRDSIKRVSLDESRARQILPATKYEYPPSQNKIPFDRVTEEDLTQLPEGRDKGKQILDAIGGLSPVMARAVSDGEDAGAIASKINELTAMIWRMEFEPVCYIKGEGTPADFHVIRIDEYEERYSSIAFDTVSEAAYWFYTNRQESNRVRQKAKTLDKQLHSLIKKTGLKIQRLKEDLQKAEDSEKYRLYGELITANIHQMKTGDKEVTLTNYYDGKPVTIPLDQRYAPAKNAQIYFKKYSKSKTALVEKRKQLEDAASDEEYLGSVQCFVENAQTTEELDEIRMELESGGYVRSRKTKERKRKNKIQPYEYRTSSGLRVLVGRNNKENDELTMRKAGRMDIWFHTKDIPGSHTIVFTEGRELTENDIYEAAGIAAWHSKGRGSENVPVDYTQIRHVKKPVGAKPGMVIFTDNRTVYVTPVDPCLQNT